MKIPKDVEYALMSLVVLDEADAPAPARALAERLRIPAALLAKILQRLNRAGVLESVQGAQGGYALARPLEEISLAAVAEAVHGPIGLVPCLRPRGSCDRRRICKLREPMMAVQELWASFLDAVSVKQFAAFERGAVVSLSR
jgi:Rrf2 family protein